MNKFIVFFMVVILIMLLTACPSLNDKKFKIKSVGWVIENVDRKYWLKPYDASMFLYLEINYEGNISSAMDIESIHVSNVSGANWTLKENGFYLNAQENYIIPGRLYESVIDNKANRLALGSYVVTVELANGSRSQESITITEPGATSKGSKSFVYSEDYAGSTNGGIAMLQRSVVIGSPKKDSSNISLSFNCDNRTYNGWLWFNNSNDDYIGKSPLFYDKITLTSASFLNNGTGISSSGSNNISLSSTDIIYNSGFNFNDIASCVIFVTDGQQFTDSYEFNYIAYSNYISFE